MFTINCTSCSIHVDKDGMAALMPAKKEASAPISLLPEKIDDPVANRTLFEPMTPMTSHSSTITTIATSKSTRKQSSLNLQDGQVNLENGINTRSKTSRLAAKDKNHVQTHMEWPRTVADGFITSKQDGRFDGRVAGTTIMTTPLPQGSAREIAKSMQTQREIMDKGILG